MSHITRNQGKRGGLGKKAERGNDSKRKNLYNNVISFLIYFVGLINIPLHISAMYIMNIRADGRQANILNSLFVLMPKLDNKIYLISYPPANFK